jgi:hypothetical protein
VIQLNTENADRNLTSLVTVLTHTPDASNPVLCQGLVVLGDGTKNLDGTGGDFSLVITVGGQTIQPSPQVVTFGTEVRSAVWTTPFPVPANAEVILRVLSPNGADTDVDVTAYLFDLETLPGDAVPRFRRAVKGITLGTCDAGGSTTSIVTSSLDPAAAVTDQFKGKIVTFAEDTTTANLRGQSTDITGSTAAGVLTVTALTTAPASGDTFSIS